ncbi:MAG: T9SS type A sorting domain-containing protein [Ignavibacteriales bacterium]|nr:T9SS type A sorting domain-containing protein [Ignavibacteriales bacterium]
MYLYNQALYMATNGYSSSQSLGVIKTTDNGNNFIQLNNGLTNLNIKQLILKPGVFIALTGDGIFCSLDEGNYWTPFNLSGLNANINSVYLDNNQTLYACTDNGIYVFTGVLNVEDEIIPTIFVLQQNYPNPFNPSTKICYTIPISPTSSPLAKGRNEVGFVTLKVYDILGKEIATLLNEEKSAGSYEIEFNASHLASGIYYYQLRAGDYVETKKMVLMK